MSINNEKIYWRGYEELTNDLEFVKNAESEFNMPGEEEKSLLADRRDFLKAMGFGIAAVSLAACEAPVKHAIPLLNKPEEYDPGIANYYASTFFDGGDYCSVLVKTREGRPIKIEGNKLSSLTKGGTSVKTQASVLGLYDNNRYKGPGKGNQKLEWAALDEEVKQKLEAIKASGKTLYLISNTNISPSSGAAISRFSAAFGNVKYVQYDTYSAQGLLDAVAESTGQRVLPGYDFSKAKTIVSLGADFLGTWISPTEYSHQFAKTRRVGPQKKEMSRLYVFESLMSLTGANADYRTSVKPSESGLIAAELYNAVAALLGQPGIDGVPKSKNNRFVDKAAKDLVAHQGSSLVVDGSNDKNIQKLVLQLNVMLKNIGNTLSFASPSLLKKGNDAEMLQFAETLKNGQAGGVLFMNCNPVYDFPKGAEIKSNLSKADLSLSFAYAPDETSAACQFVAPNHYFLESWGDAEPKKGYFSLVQPAITPIFKTRQAEESLLVWAGQTESYYDFVKGYWKANMYPSQKFGYNTFKDFWNYSLHDGIFEVNGQNPRKAESSGSASQDSLAASAPAPVMVSLPEPQVNVNLSGVAAGIAASAQGGSGFELVVYEKVGMGTGSQANNPWLQEFPDPVTRACWENYLTIPMSLAKEKGISVKEGKTVKINLKAGGKTITLPAIVQPGQNGQTLGIALGYGRAETGKTGKDIGAHACPLISVSSEGLRYFSAGASIEVAGESHQVAHVQTHHTVMGRKVVQETTLERYSKDQKDGRFYPLITTPNGEEPANQYSLWYNDEEAKANGQKDKLEGYPNPNAVGPNKRPNHMWGMVVDMNTCFGCGACVVACNAENNVPVVGKQEVLNRREMHWIRIDRYYSTDMSKQKAEKEGVGTLDMYRQMEMASDDPEVTFQPMMCQHCNNAPCETVCPVAATTHSTEGLNQMAYNRCIGTRYCANNCPYKVRRFNWFSYPENSEFDFNVNNNLGKMVLNPDVTVRARGVMEKCTMCVQRIQEGKLYAKKESRRPVDGEINVACAQACPSGAITFGDVSDKNSEISRLLAEHGEGRAYTLLEEISTRPSVVYLSKVRNKA
jgi:molybdopterin-containing oxidoreductase family iron-sulfur binding subunit